MKKIKIFVGLILVLVSCSNNDGNSFYSAENYSNSNVEEKEEIFLKTNQLALFHSASLDFIYHNIKSNEIAGEYNPMINIDDSVDKLLNSKISTNLTKVDLELIKDFYKSEKTGYYNDVPDDFRVKKKLHDSFLVDISSIKESDISLETIKGKLFSKEYIDLDNETFYELSLIASTYLDSYNYWNKNLFKWNELKYFENGSNVAKGYWGGVLRYVNKDANAASAILISAAVITAATGGTGAIVTGPALLIGAGIRSALPF